MLAVDWRQAWSPAQSATSIGLKLHQRNLTESQRAAVAAKLANESHGGDRRSDRAANLLVVSQATAAGLLNVSERSVRAAAKVMHDGDDVLMHAVERGEVGTMPPWNTFSSPF